MTNETPSQELAKLIASIDEKLDSIENEELQKKLSETLDQLYRLQGKQIDQAIDRASSEYRAVTAELKGANADLKAALEDTSKLASTIGKITGMVTKISGIIG